MTSETNKSVLPPEEVERIRGAVGDLAGTYEQVREAAAARLRAFREELARRVQPHFVDFLRSLPSGTIEEKQNLAKVANYEAGLLGLSFRVPKTGECGYLAADTSGSPRVGEFLFGVLRGEKKTKVRCDANLPKIELMAYDGSRDEKVNWYERVSASRRDGSRKRT